MRAGRARQRRGGAGAVGDGQARQEAGRMNAAGAAPALSNAELNSAVEIGGAAGERVAHMRGAGGEDERGVALFELSLIVEGRERERPFAALAVGDDDVAIGERGLGEANERLGEARQRVRVQPRARRREHDDLGVLGVVVEKAREIVGPKTHRRAAAAQRADNRSYRGGCRACLRRRRRRSAPARPARPAR